MSFGHELQVLRADSSYWENASQSGRDYNASNSNTTAHGFNGGGEIFEDTKGNIWVGGSNYPLNVLRPGKKKLEIVGGLETLWYETQKALLFMKIPKEIFE